MENILFGLNDQQKCAVSCPSDVLQVLAPPGSGKTKTLTARVAYHIAHDGLKPWNMIVCTFTIKAAREMKERIRAFVGEELERKLILGTFHSVARRYLSTYGHHIGIPAHFGIADSNDSLAMIKRIIKRNNFSMEPARARSAISKRKSGLEAFTSTRRAARIEADQQEFEAICAEYEEELKSAKLLDYDDLLLRCVELLTKFPECVSNIEAVLIDEFQDTNHVQYELMNLFAQHRQRRPRNRVPKITIVGDPDQSIYSFRSAEIENLARMQGKYKDTQIVHLEENYRSSGAILRLALEVIEQDASRPQKSVRATHSVGESPVLRTLASAGAEAAWLVSEIRRSLHLNAGLLNYADYAVLLRSASLSRLIEAELGRAGIPYRMVGGHKFFDRVEVRILLDYLRVISQPDHNDALLRVLNVPSRKLGETATKVLLEESHTRQKSLWHIVKGVAQGKLRTAVKLSQQAVSGLENFVNIILTAHQKLLLPHTSVADLLAHVMHKTNYETFLKDTYKQEYEDRSANVDELIQLAHSGRVFAEQEAELIELDGVQQAIDDSTTPASCLAQFLANIALATDAEKHDAEDSMEKVVISTIHAAKGLEWPVVFIPSVYEGSIPHSRAENIDEERRLLYVGITRAKSLLYLSYPKKSTNTERTTLSSFLSTPTMARYYHDRGPTFGWQVSRDLASILGRDCPSSADIHERYKLIGTDQTWDIHAEDDQYPDDEAKFDNSKLLSNDTCTAEPFHRTYGGQSQKRKFGRMYESDAVQASVEASCGFISARYAKIQTDSEIPHPADRPEEKSRSYKIPAKSSDLSKSDVASQKSIKTFFSLSTNQAPQRTVALDTPSLKTSIQVRPPMAIASKTFRSNQMGKCSSTTSPSLPPRQVKQPRLVRPQFEMESETQRRKHILLSSSPVKDSTDLICHDSAGMSEEEIEKENQQQAAKDEQARKLGFCKSTVFHQTSMEKLSSLQNRPGARRTIGNRPVPGSRVHAQFRPPTIK
ncbi:uncharacterized protein PV09_01902 [Verruconis gallopava]|uniref:DNA 3'-5' helicase n=1 Tax=Verruconis gallopava TaxID=253628 RepID=A0A0D1Z280_9PEZI|nr:uncharacterized protein PV09_01902 [Verruconis gallopava]KIW07007.1 hypothetical protein PV09_01902 [Verruconis gallopava]